MRNSMSSALTYVNGNCPAANYASYIQGLVVCDDCVQLVIEDSGPNDADFLRNGSVEDPGAGVVERLTCANYFDNRPLYRYESFI